jgi:type 1 glutamine amidotransferase
MKLLLSAFLCVTYFLSPAVAEDAKPRPLRILLITGGCCHDYKYQAKKYKEGTDKHTNAEWTVMLDPRTGTKGEIDLYKDADWAKHFDVVVHNECFADTDSPEYIRKITDAHKAGVPAVVIHCAMHTYRATKIDDWREFLGVSSFMHEHQSEYPVTPAEKAKDHPIMKGFPATWKTPKDELYVIAKQWPNMTPLATSKSERDGKEYATFWTNTYGKARVFGTTWGHGNATWDDQVFIDTLVRGTLWAAGKLEDDGKPSKGYGPQPKTSTDAK